MEHRDLTASGKPQTALVFWVIWAALLVEPFVFREFLGGEGEGVGSPVWMWPVYGGLVLVSLGVRFLLLPRTREAGKMLVGLIIGLSCAEMIMFLGLFLFTSQADMFFYTCVALNISYIPTYARNLKPA